MKMITAAAVLSAFVAGPLAARDLVYISEQHAVCYVHADAALLAGHWECDQDTEQCHCVADYLYDEASSM